MKFVQFDANYFNKSSKGDCVIRALCLATGYGYKKICDLLGVDFLPGVGYGWANSQGISFDELMVFAKKTKLIKPIEEEIDWDFVDFLKGHGPKDDMMDVGSGFSLEDTIDNNLIPDEREYRRLVVLLHSQKNLKDLHAVCVDNHTKTYYDTRANESAKYGIVYAIFAADMSKIPSQKDPDYYSNEKARILKDHADYLKNLKHKN